jgi:hypothetical protein
MAKRIPRKTTANKPASKPTAQQVAWFMLCAKFNRERAKIEMYNRTGRLLEVWAQLSDGDGIQTSTTLSKWPELGRQLSKGCDHGLVAVRQKEASFVASPGLTMVLTDPMGGGMAARQAMQVFARHGMGGALAFSESGTSLSILKFIFCPHWYATSGDQLFGLDWSEYDSPDADLDYAKVMWCQGVLRTVDDVLSQLPSLVVDTVCFDNYACTDRLDDLTPTQLKALAKVAPGDLEVYLLSL